MYLVARPKSQAKHLIAQLTDNDFVARYLPLIELEYNTSRIAASRDLIAQYEAILVTSPAAIDAIAPKIVGAKLPRLIYVVGKASAKSLQKYHYPVQIIYPRQNSGAKALINECLLPARYLPQSILVIGGEKINSQLATGLTDLSIKYEFLSIYQRVNIAVKDLVQFKKDLTENKITGIIITSKLIGKFLLDCIAQLDLSEWLSGIQIISIHSQITEFLQQEGYNNVYQTASADNQAIVNLIEEINK